MKNFTTIICLLLLINLKGYSQTQNDTNETVFTTVEHPPEFPGGGDSLMSFITSHIKYPEAEKINGTEAVIYVGFVVNKEGKVTNPKIFRSNNKNFNDEALRVIALLPLWQPGRQAGEKVNVQFTIPISFSLRVEDDKKKRD